jgi:hypothetical protein
MQQKMMKMKTKRSKIKNELDLLRAHFEQKDYKAVIELIQSAEDWKYDPIATEEDAEITALSAFSAFNLRMYKDTLSYSRSLMTHLEKNSQTQLASDLYENLILITLDSHIALGQHFRAFQLLRSKGQTIQIEKSDVKLRESVVKQKVAGSLHTFLNYFLLTICFAIIFFPGPIKSVYPLAYLPLLIFFIAIIVLTLVIPGKIYRIIRGFLD